MLRSLCTIRGLTLALLLTAGPLGLPALADADPLPTLPAADSPAGWQPYKVKRGIAVERRPVAGSRFFEYRTIVAAPVPPEPILEYLWRFVSEGKNPIVKKRQVLKREPTEIVMYDQVKTPVVSDRDYTIMVRKVTNPSRHRYEMTFETANQLGPPVDPHYVRIPILRGRWLIESETPGKSRLTYQSFSEPGGSIPAFLIHGAQFDQILHDVEALLKHLETVPKTQP